MSETILQPATAPRALTRTHGRLDYFYGLVLTIERPVNPSVDASVWSTDIERMLQRSYQHLHGQPVQNLRIVHVEETPDGVVVVAHHDQVLKGVSARMRGTQAGRKHRRQAQRQNQGLIFVSLQHWVVPALRLMPEAA